MSSHLNFFFSHKPSWTEAYSETLGKSRDRLVSTREHLPMFSAVQAHDIPDLWTVGPSLRSARITVGNEEFAN
jgi:hypothetical protein